MVSIIEMPAMVVEASFAESRIMTRLELTRRLESRRATSMSTRTEKMPSAAR